MEILIFTMFVFSGMLLTFMLGAVIRIRWLEADRDLLSAQKTEFAQQADSANKTLRDIDQMMRRVVLARRPDVPEDQIGAAFGEMFSIVETTEIDSLRRRVAMAEQPRPMRERLAGYVYLIRDLDVTGYCKIGRATDPKSRLRTFEVKLPFETEVLALIETRDPSGLESLLHRCYALKRIRGEWFNLDAADIEAIQRMAGKET